MIDTTNLGSSKILPVEGPDRHGVQNTGQSASRSSHSFYALTNAEQEMFSINGESIKLPEPGSTSTSVSLQSLLLQLQEFEQYETIDHRLIDSLQWGGKTNDKASIGTLLFRGSEAIGVVHQNGEFWLRPDLEVQVDSSTFTDWRSLADELAEELDAQTFFNPAVYNISFF